MVPVCACPFCEADGGLLVFRHEKFRVIQASEPGFPAFYRVIWNAHVTEFSDLPVAERELCMHAVVAVELVLRGQLSPQKMNLASLGNAVAHLHWHVIARFAWDSHFPGSVWATQQRAEETEKLTTLAASLGSVNRQMADKLGAMAL